MTREQIIILAFIAGAFVVGWAASSVTAFFVRRGEGDRTLAGANGRRPLSEEVSDALQNDAANDTMVSALGAGRGPALSELELDLTDWGFTYGVAWAEAREQQPHEADDVIAREALRAAEQVFRTYTDSGDWRQTIEERSANGRQTAHSPSPRTTS